MNNDTAKPENAVDRMLRENNIRLVWSKDRQIPELRPTFVPIAPAGFRWPKDAA